MYKSLIFAIIVFYFAQYLYKKTLYKFLNELKNRIFGEPAPDNEASSEDFYKELLIDPLTDANNKAINERNIFLQRGNRKFDCSSFSKYRFKEEVGGKSYDAYQEILKNRVTQIDSVIDDHLRFLKVESEWKEKPQSDKLDYLFSVQK